MIIKNWKEMTKDQKRAAKEFVKSQIGRVSPQSEQIPPNARSIKR